MKILLILIILLTGCSNNCNDYIGELKKNVPLKCLQEDKEIQRIMEETYGLFPPSEDVQNVINQAYLK